MHARVRGRPTDFDRRQRDPPIAGSITYNAALGLRSMQLGNGATYSIAADPSSRNRPTTISTLGVKKNNLPFDLSMANPV